MLTLVSTPTAVTPNSKGKFLACPCPAEARDTLDIQPTCTSTPPADVDKTSQFDKDKASPSGRERAGPMFNNETEFWRGLQGSLKRNLNALNTSIGGETGPLPSVNAGKSSCHSPRRS